MQFSITEGTDSPVLINSCQGYNKIYVLPLVRCTNTAYKVRPVSLQESLSESVKSYFDNTLKGSECHQQYKRALEHAIPSKKIPEVAIAN